VPDFVPEPSGRGGDVAAELWDRLAIADVLHRYARSVDRRDWPGVRDCYADDAVDDHGAYRGDADGLVEWMIQRHEHIALSMHYVSNVLVEFAGPDVAVAEAYCVTVQRTPARHAGQALAMYGIAQGDGADDTLFESVVRCRFVDTLRRGGGRWRIWRRTVVFESVDCQLVPAESRTGADWAVGSRGPDDPLWRARGAAGSSAGAPVVGMS
jgi:hypothetical protein